MKEGERRRGDGVEGKGRREKWRENGQSEVREQKRRSNGGGKKRETERERERDEEIVFTILYY